MSTGEDEPLTTEEEERYRESVADVTSRRGDVWTETPYWVRRLLATVKVLREANVNLARLAIALEPTGDHHTLPDGYCLDCQGGCIRDMAAENSETIRQAAYADPSPFMVKRVPS